MGDPSPILFFSGRQYEQQFRTTFLMTYKSFTDAATVFSLLTERYSLEHPPNLSENQFMEWKEKKLRQSQARVLNMLQEWVESYRFVKDEPHMVMKLVNFLTLVQSPPKHVAMAKQLLQTVERQVSGGFKLLVIVMLNSLFL